MAITALPVIDDVDSYLVSKFRKALFRTSSNDIESDDVRSKKSAYRELDKFISKFVKDGYSNKYDSLKELVTDIEVLANLDLHEALKFQITSREFEKACKHAESVGNLDFDTFEEIKKLTHPDFHQEILEAARTAVSYAIISGCTVESDTRYCRADYKL